MPIIIDPSFVDVELDKDPNFVNGDITPASYYELAQNEFEADEAPIPEDQWPKLYEETEAAGGGIERLIKEILNQLREGSCVGQATDQAAMIIGAKQFGKDRFPRLSAISIYDRIGSSAGSGAMVSDAMEEIIARGIVPLDVPENRLIYPVCMPATGFSKKMPSNWQEVAANFKATECQVIKGIDKLVTASFKGHPIVVGRSGHSICYIRPMFRNGKLGFLYVNSWGNWGFGAGEHKYGFGWDSLSMVNSSARWAFAIRSMVIPQVLLPVAA